MLPKEYLQLMGVEDISQMGNYVTFFGMIFNILIIIMSIYAVTFSMNLILKEEKKKKPLNICTLYLLPEKKFMCQKYWWLCVPFFFVVLSVGIAGIIFGFASGSDTFSMVDMSSVIKITGTVPFFFAALGLFLSSLSSKYVSSGLGAGIVMLTYMLGYLGKLLEGKADFLKYFSPFELLSPTNALALSGETYGAFGVIAALTVILLIFASIAYKKRDFSL